MGYKSELKNIIDKYASDFKKASALLYSVESDKAYTVEYKNKYKEDWIVKFRERGGLLREELEAFFERKHTSMSNLKMEFTRQYKVETHLRIQNYINLIEANGTNTDLSTIKFIFSEFKNDPITIEWLLGTLRKVGFDAALIDVLYFNSIIYTNEQTFKYMGQIKKYLLRLSTNLPDIEMVADLDNLGIAVWDKLNDNLDYIIEPEEKEKYSAELDSQIYDVFIKTHGPLVNITL